MSSTSFTVPPGYTWQYHFLLWVQSFHSERWDQVAIWLSRFGTEWFYVLALPILFWSIHKTIGLRVTYVFLSSMYVNGWIKDTIRVARPVGVPGIRSLFLSSAPGYSFPSGHAQGPATFWTLIGQWIGRLWFWILALLLIFGIGASRVYLGLHWPTDVLVGWGLGFLFGWFGWWIGRWWTYREYGFAIRLTFAILWPVIAILIHPGRSSLEYGCLLLGIGVGAVLEERWWKLDLERELWKRLCSAVIGLGGLAGLYVLFRLVAHYVTSGTMEPSYAWCLAVRDVAIGAWGTLGAPYIFWKCGLYHARG